MIYFPRPFTLTKQKYTSQTSQKKKNLTKRREGHYDWYTALWLILHPTLSIWLNLKQEDD